MSREGGGVVQVSKCQTEPATDSHHQVSSASPPFAALSETLANQEAKGPNGPLGCRTPGRRQVDIEIALS